MIYHLINACCHCYTRINEQKINCHAHCRSRKQSYVFHDKINEFVDQKKNDNDENEIKIAQHVVENFVNIHVFDLRNQIDLILIKAKSY